MTRTFIRFASACTLALTGALPAQTVTPVEERNAALKYWAAWSQITPELAEQVRALDWDAIGTTSDPAKLPAAVREAGAAAESVGHALVDASRLKVCDFELPYEAGWGMLLPHLSKARDGARVLRADARARLAAGDVEGAAERVGALYRTARHLAHDGVMISSLVALSIAGQANAETEAIVAGGRLTAPARDALRSAMPAPADSDPYGMKRAVGFERAFIGGWVRSTFTGPDAGEKLSRYMTVEMGAAEGLPERVRTMDGAAMAREADQVNRFYDETLAAWGTPGADGALGALDEKVTSGGFGPVVQLLGAAVRKAHEADAKGKAARARIDGLLSGAAVTTGR